MYAWLGVEPPRGVLLHGPPGCGKTALANAIANECGVPFLRISAPEIVAGVSGEYCVLQHGGEHRAVPLLMKQRCIANSDTLKRKLSL